MYVDLNEINNKIKEINKNKNPKYIILTMGCQLNENDSEKMAGMLKGAGYSKTEKIEDADVIVFNTCCVRENAESRLFGKLGEVKKYKEEKGTIIAIVNKEKKSVIRTEEVFTKQNKYIDRILETIDRDEGKREKNSIVSIRSYLDRAIGESLNQALYDLEVQRERFPDKKELFTAKGSIRYVAQYLLNNKQ